MGSHFEPDGRSGGEGVPTLGAFVVRLRPGSACVCCGAELRAKKGQETAGGPGVQGAAGSEGAAVAACPRCGSEVAEVTGDEEALTGAVVLEPAA
ncbi:MAG: hypothetical protein A2W26_00190 [Acidobacteria bacterium RBG_16_64_8]|nr:MAG: hypothetical protein A2W26_00190 [Acidobacteria bacterium RBG_16_64_8]